MPGIDKRAILLDPEDQHLIEGVEVYLGTDGYPLVYTGTSGFAHRPLHRLVMGDPPGVLFDHKNQNKLDARKANLRPATKQQNGFNRGKPAHNSSGYKGVSWHKQMQRWRAYIMVGGRQRSLGLFDSKVDAAAAYDQAATRMHGEFAHLNGGCT